MAEGLSDALRQMAAGEHTPPQPGQRPAPGGRSAVNGDAEAGEQDELAAGAAAPPSAGASPRRSAPVDATAGRMLKLGAAAALLAMGLTMVAMAGWATLILLGHEVWRSDQPGARSVATGLLVTYPLAACLLATAAVLVRRAMKQ